MADKPERTQRTRLIVFTGGVLEVADYGDGDTGVYLEHWGHMNGATEDEAS